jgi:hypothetical protein
MWKRVVITALLISSSWGHATGASAQTAEETVMFLLNGTEDGDTAGGAKVRKVDKNTWTFAFENGNTVRARVVQVSPCRYEISSSAKSEENFVYDFSGLRDVEIQDIGPGLGVKFLGATRVNGSSTQPLDGQVFLAYTQVERLKRAVSYFRSTFCKGRAF